MIATELCLCFYIGFSKQNFDLKLFFVNVFSSKSLYVISFIISSCKLI